MGYNDPKQKDTEMISQPRIPDVDVTSAYDLHRKGTTVTPKGMYSKLTSFCSNLWSDLVPSTHRSEEEANAVIAEISYSNQFINY
jgi:hypothetical protein